MHTENNINKDSLGKLNSCGFLSSLEGEQEVRTISAKDLIVDEFLSYINK